MKQKKSIAGILRRLEAGLLAAGTLWIAVVTAGSDTAASAASAAVDTVRSLATQTPEGDWYSVAVCSDGSYGIEKGLICSFPVRTTKDGGWEIVQGLPVDAFSREKIDATVNELKEERDAVSSLLKH